MLRILNGEPYGLVSDTTQGPDGTTESLRYDSVDQIRSFYESGIDSLKGGLMSSIKITL